MVIKYDLVKEISRQHHSPARPDQQQLRMANAHGSFGKGFVIAMHGAGWLAQQKLGNFLVTD